MLRKAKAAQSITILGHENNNNLFVSGFNKKKNMSYQFKKEADPINMTTYMVAIEEEDEVLVKYDRDPSTVKCVFLPSNKFKTWWDMYIIFVLIYVATVVPYRVCLIDDSSFFMEMVDALIDLSFVVDIFLTFFSSFR